MNLDWNPNDPRIAGEEYAKYAPFYDLLFDGLDDDASYYLACAAAVKGPLLELGVGTGRLAQRLLQAGHSMLGMDASPEMLEKARLRLAPFGQRCRLLHADLRSMELGERFPLALAPYGMTAHLLTDEDRLQAFRQLHKHLEPGGLFVYDDRPGWMAGPADGSQLEERRRVKDPATGQTVRLLANWVDVAGEPYSLRYDFIDWLDASGGLLRRMLVKILFRNVSLERELELLKQAGFQSIKALGGFDGRALDRAHPQKNDRLLLRCRA